MSVFKVDLQNGSTQGETRPPSSHIPVMKH